jgi:hypothetical protein
MNIRFCGLLQDTLALIIGAMAAWASITGTISGVVTDPAAAEQKYSISKKVLT